MSLIIKVAFLALLAELAGVGLLTLIYKLLCSLKKDK